MNTLEIIEKYGYTIVQLNRGKANAINFEMVQELRETFERLSENDKARGEARTTPETAWGR